MNTDQQMESRLWDYIDGNLSADEASFVADLVRTNQEWQQKHAELLQVHSMMYDSFELDMPSIGFTRNVMEEISTLQITRATKKYINKKIIWGIGSFFTITLLGFIIYAFSQATWSADSPSTLPLNLESMNFGRLLSSAYTNVFLLVNTILGLMVLDMYLDAKKKKLLQRDVL